MEGINIIKRYAIYFRFNEIYKDKREKFRLGYIDLKKIHEQIADEFGYESTRMVTDAINFINRNRTNPYIQRAAMLFCENRTNYWAKYDTEQDLQNIELIDSCMPTTRYKTRTPFIHYFIYMRFLELKKEKGAAAKNYDIYYLLSDEFYYQEHKSIRNIVSKVRKILCKETASK